MRLTMQYRKPGERWKFDESWVRSFLDVLQHTSGTWVAADHDEMVARLQKMTARSQAHAATAPAPSSSGATPRAANDGAGAPPTSVGLETLSSADRNRFDDAVKEQQAGHPHEAWVKAEPLFAAYPAVQAVQDLRCKLALQQGMGWQQARAECAGLMQLTPGLRGPNRAR
jgi:hypothetical protein